MPTLDLFSLVEDTISAPAHRPLPKPMCLPPASPQEAANQEGEVVSGWIKTYQGPPLSAGSVTSLATLTRVSGDGHAYREAKFRLAGSVTVEEYPGGFGLRGLRVKGQKELISLYDAVRRELAQETE